MTEKKPMEPPALVNTTPEITSGNAAEASKLENDKLIRAGLLDLKNYLMGLYSTGIKDVTIKNYDLTVVCDKGNYSVEEQTKIFEGLDTAIEDWMERMERSADNTAALKLIELISESDPKKPHLTLGAEFVIK